MKRARQMREYAARVGPFLEANPVCQWPLGCERRSVVLHHRRGRSGLRLLDEAWWAAACWEHNQAAEDETGRALECGWLVRIEGAA